MISASQFLALFKNPFDPTGSILIKCAQKEGVTPEELQLKWHKERDDSVIRGVSFHSAAEHFIKTGKIKQDHNAKLVKLFKKKHSFEGELLTEKRLWSEEHGIAGTADIVELFDDNTISIQDFKTNKKLDDKAFFGKKLFAPLNHIPDSKFHLYELQLSLYAFLLEEKGYWNRGGNNLFWIDFNAEDVVKIPIEYKRADIIKAIEFYKKNKHFLNEKTTHFGGIDPFAGLI